MSEPWMVDQGTVEALLPLVARLLQGENVQFGSTNREDGPDESTPYCYHPAANSSYYNFSEAPAGSVAVFPVVGAITKFDTWCSEGTETLMARMAAADRMENISGHLLEIDSGGGQGTNIETVARFIRAKLEKPVVAWFNGVAASAAYWMAAAADEVYASEPTDQVGSIGVYFTFMDMRKRWEEMGIKVHEIYAEQSDLKNRDFLLARDGEYKQLREKMLNPYADRFISQVKEMRPGLTDARAFRGEIFTAPEAQQIGMIDGQLDFEAAIERVTALAAQRAANSNTSTNNIEMKQIEVILGYSLETDKDGGAYLQAQELEKLNAAMADGNEVPAEVGATIERLTAEVASMAKQQAEINASLEALKANNTQLANQLAEQKNELDRVGGQPGAGPTRVAVEKDPADEKPDALDEFERAAAAADRLVVE